MCEVLRLFLLSSLAYALIYPLMAHTFFVLKVRLQIGNGKKVTAAVVFAIRGVFLSYNHTHIKDYLLTLHTPP